MTLDAPNLSGLDGMTIGPATVRIRDGAPLIEVLGREATVAFDVELVRCAIAAQAHRPADQDPAEFDRRLVQALALVERGQSGLLKLVHAPAHPAVYCYVWIGVESSLPDLLAAARHCVALSYAVEDLARQVAGSLAVDVQLRNATEGLVEGSATHHP